MGHSRIEFLKNWKGQREYVSTGEKKNKIRNLLSLRIELLLLFVIATTLTGLGEFVTCLTFAGIISHMI